MMKISLILFGVLAVAAAGWFLLLRPPSYTNTPPGQGPIVAVGDSLVRGVGATEGGDFVSGLAGRLNRPVENLGVSGDTTADVLARIDSVVERKPSVVLVLAGGNDYLRRVPKAQTFENLRAIIARLQEAGALTVVLGVRGGLLSDNYAADYKKLAADTGSVYVSDVLKDLLGNPQYMSDDIHPNNQGYAIIAERVFHALRPVLK